MEQTVSTGAQKLTHADLLAFYPQEDRTRRELIDGELFVSSTPRLRHQRIVQRIARSIDDLVRRTSLGEVCYVGMDVILSEQDVVNPDILFVRSEQRAILQDWVRGVPDLVVEVLSPSNRRHDEVRKRDLYERYRVTEYWIVDPEAEAVKVYRLVGDAFEHPALLTGRDGDALTTPLLPGFALPVAAVFAD